MNLIEALKSFLPKKEVQPTKQEKHVINDYTEDDNISTGAFFDGTKSGSILSFTGRDNSFLEKQKAKIMTYRNLTNQEEVQDALDEIVNEIVFTNEKEIIKINIDETNEKIVQAIEDAFKKIIGLLNVKKNMYGLVRQTYIDGQINLFTQYNDNQKEGLSKIGLLDPIYFYYDPKVDLYKYKEQNDYSGISTNDEIVTYQKEEIVRNDFGLKAGPVVLGYLENAIKPINQLRALEDLLIPMRFSRSISRRVFNVDTGELSYSKSEEVMNEMSKKFKYKKFYNTDTGEITNQQHLTSMVEDYWFANRAGGKGTQVDLLDETGNLGELGDIMYFKKKSYSSLKVPLNRIADNQDAQEFDYDATQTNHDELKFFYFINRVRSIYVEVFNELLRRELISTEVLTNENYEEYKEKIEIQFVSESIFIEKMKLSLFNSKLEIYATLAEYAGKLFPVAKILKDVFGFNDEEIKENFDAIEKESKNKMFASFYQKEDDGSY